MTMMISKFHRLIQSKILWGIFAVVISIAMVGLFSDVPMTKRTNAEAASVGSLDGEPVSYDEFQHAYQNTRTQAALTYGRSLPRTDEVEERLRELAWKRVVSLRKIRELDIQVSDAEVLGGIQQQSLFHNEQGQFDTRVYAVFLNRFLQEQLGIGQNQFEAYMREELAMNKFQQLIAQSILISPAELQRAFRTVTDVFAVDYIEILPSAITEVTATEEEAKAFFEENKEGFRTPEMAVVNYATFSVTDAMEGVEVTEEEALAFYNENIEDYRIEEDENAVEDAIEAVEDAVQDLAATIEETGETVAETAETIEVAAGTDTAETPEVFDLTVPSADEAETLLDSALTELPSVTELTYQDFKDVRESIMESIRGEKAHLLTGEAATDFVLAVQDSAYKGITFKQHAKEAGITLGTTAPFSSRQIPEGINAGASFARDAFDLGSDLTDSFSDPIEGRDVIYVISLQERIPDFIPGFADVQEEATGYASQRKSAEALVTFGESISEKWKKELAAGKDFADLAKEAGYDLTQLTEITAATGIQDSDYQDILFRGFLTRSQGELSDLLPVEDKLLLTYVRARNPAPAQSFSEYRPRIVQNLIGERASRVFNDFQDHLLNTSAFTDKSAEEDDSEDAS